MKKAILIEEARSWREDDQQSTAQERAKENVMRRRRTTPHEKGYTYRRGKILERRRPTEYCPRACKGNCY